MSNKTFVLALSFVILMSAAAFAQKTPTLTLKKNMPQVAKGTFEVKVMPVPAEKNIGDPLIGRYSLDKTFAGDIVGTSKGQMLASGNETDKGTGGYVAMEHVIGTLNGKKGSFSLQQHGKMGDGKYEMNVDVVPGTGTGELTGISGKLTIKIEGGKHFYELEYTLPSK